MSSSVSAVYLYVIEDVTTKVRDEFINSGAGESVLGELQALWEAKMMQCGVISPNIERPLLQKQIGPIIPVHDLNVPPVEEHVTPTAEMLFPQTPMQTPMPQTPIQTPMTGMEQIYNTPTGLSDYALFTDVSSGGDMKAGRPSPYRTLPSAWMNQRPLGVDVNVAYVESREEVDRVAPHHPTTQDFFMIPSGKRKRDGYAPHLTFGGYMPQQDGAGDTTIEFLLPKENQVSFTRLGCSFTTDLQCNKETRETPALPQQDGVHDEYDEFRFQGATNEDYNTPTPSEHVDLRSTTPLVDTPKPTKSESAEDDEPPLNEDDDEDDLEDFDQGEEEPNAQHLVLAQFDKVSRTKSKWKCTLKDGIMHINSRDILFNKANGEFDF